MAFMAVEDGAAHGAGAQICNGSQQSLSGFVQARAGRIHRSMPCASRSSHFSA